MEISLAYKLIIGLCTLLVLAIFRLLYSLYLIPYLKLKFFKNKDGVVKYSAAGLLSTFQRDQNVHHDYYHLLRTVTLTKPKHRFIAANSGSSVSLFLRDPRLIDAYLNSQSSYQRLSYSMVFETLFPNSTLNTEGAIWKAHRSTYKSIMSLKFVDKLIPIAFDTTLEYITFIDPKKSTLEVGSFCKTVFGEFFARLFFGNKLRNFKLENGMTLSNMFSLMATGAEEAGSGLIAALFGQKFVLKGYVPVHRRLFSSVQLFKKFILSLVRERKRAREQTRGAQDSGEFTLVDAIFEHQQKNLDSIIDAEIFDEFVSFFVAGLETTAQVTTLCIYQLSKNMEYRDRLLKEATVLFKDQARFNLARLNSLEFLDGFIKESIRLNPPLAFAVSRQAKETHSLDDLIIPKGTQVSIGILQNQVNPDNFKDPEVFDPLRWGKDSVRYVAPLPAGEKRNYNYCPFSLGPRRCIGDTLSNTLCKIVLACFVKRFEFGVEKNRKMTMTAAPVYQPAEPFKLSIRRGSYAS